MNPQPVKGEVERRYGGSYLAYELANEKAFLDLQLLSLADSGFSEIEKGGAKRLLDVGCATGTLLGELSRRGWECTGAEISPEQAAYAREERGLDVRPLALEACAFEDASFDVALASHLIEHLNDPASFAAELARVLAPGGHIFITTPNIDGFQARLFREKWRSAIFDHLYLFSARTLAALLEKNGFLIEKVVTWGGLAAGSAPAFLKRCVDKMAKRFGFGDVMMVRAVKEDGFHAPRRGRAFSSRGRTLS
jgi:2-polyprenyl-3-methyl-5-hydroxy-6-metoxy-1,4-benzoquinol methylase